MFRVPSLVFANVPRRIDGIAFLPRDTGLRRCAEITVRMSHTTVQQLDPVFANNVTEPPVEVLHARDYAVPSVEGQLMSLGLQRPFDYFPPRGDLLIEIVAMDVTRNGQTQDKGFHYDYSTNVPGEAMYALEQRLPIVGGGAEFPKLVLCTGAGDLGWFGEGCAGASGAVPGLGLSGSPALGGTTDVWVSNARPSSATQILLGVDNAPPLPQDLTAFGMPGCRLYVAPLDALAGLTDAVGVLRLALTIPNRPDLVGAILYSQALVVDPGANAAGLVTTNYGRLLVGR
jgi:hypothetical protein